jgi:hypothetical protein
MHYAQQIVRGRGIGQLSVASPLVLSPILCQFGLYHFGHRQVVALANLSVTSPVRALPVPDSANSSLI